jgi:hypothetical protein
MLFTLYVVLSIIDLSLIVLALVLRLNEGHNPSIPLTFSVLSLPFSLLLSVNSGLLETINTAWDATNSSFVTSTYTYTGSIYLMPVWLGFFFVGFVMTVAFTMESIAFRRKQKEEHEFDL